jgi:hypothetical protein
MKTPAILKCLLAALVAWGGVTLGRAAEGPAEKQPTREDWQKMSPQERQTRAKEMREKFEKMPPEQREALRKVWRDRIEKRIDELKKKKKAGTITEPEVKRLEQWEKRLRLWDEQKAPEPPPGKPAVKP